MYSLLGDRVLRDRNGRADDPLPEGFQSSDRDVNTFTCRAVDSLPQRAGRVISQRDVQVAAPAKEGLEDPGDEHADVPERREPAPEGPADVEVLTVGEARHVAVEDVAVQLKVVPETGLRQPEPLRPHWRDGRTALVKYRRDVAEYHRRGRCLPVDGELPFRQLDWDLKEPEAER